MAPDFAVLVAVLDAVALPPAVDVTVEFTRSYIAIPFAASGIINLFVFGSIVTDCAVMLSVSMVWISVLVPASMMASLGSGAPVLLPFARFW